MSSSTLAVLAPHQASRDSARRAEAVAGPAGEGARPPRGCRTRDCTPRKNVWLSVCSSRSAGFSFVGAGMCVNASTESGLYFVYPEYTPRCRSARCRPRRSARAHRFWHLPRRSPAGAECRAFLPGCRRASTGSPRNRIPKSALAKADRTRRSPGWPRRGGCPQLPANRAPETRSAGEPGGSGVPSPHGDAAIQPSDTLCFLSAHLTTLPRMLPTIRVHYSLCRERLTSVRGWSPTNRCTRTSC